MPPIGREPGVILTATMRGVRGGHCPSQGSAYDAKPDCWRHGNVGCRIRCGSWIMVEVDAGTSGAAGGRPPATASPGDGQDCRWPVAAAPVMRVGPVDIAKGPPGLYSVLTPVAIRPSASFLRPTVLVRLHAGRQRVRDVHAIPSTSRCRYAAIAAISRLGSTGTSI